MARMRPAFDALRQDRVRELTKAEFSELCPALQPEILEGLFRVFDSHPREGRISYNELCAYVMFSSGRGTAEEKIEALFPMCDSDGKNVVSIDDLVTGVKLLYYARYQDVEYVEFKASQARAEFLDEARLQAAEDAGEELAAPLTSGEAAESAAAQGAASEETPPKAPRECAEQEEGAVAVVEAASEELQAPSAKLRLRQYVRWARSDRPRVNELRQLLTNAQEREQSRGTGCEGGKPFETWVIQTQAKFEKIKVDNPVVELDGDEMARIIWQMIKEKLIFPFIDMDIDYYDLSITYRDETDDTVTRDAAKAIRNYNVGIKCPTITPTDQRVLEFNLKETWDSPNRTLRTILGGTVFDAPIIINGIPRCVPGWEKPIVIGRHAHGDENTAAQLSSDVPGTFKLVFEPEGGGASEELVVYRFNATPGGSEGGVMLGMCNTRDSVTSFARSCFEYALSQGLPLYLSTKSTLLKEYDGLFVDVFENMYQSSYRRAYEERGLWYQHRIIGDMVTQAMKSAGGFVWACKSHDGDVLVDFVAQGYGCRGLMTSTLVSSDGQTVVNEAAHGTVTKHYHAHQRGEKISTNPIATIFSWTRGLAHRAKLDDNARLAEFCRALEEACVTCVRNGSMSKDLATRLLGGEKVGESPGEQWLLTEDLVAAFANELRLVLSKPLKQVVVAQEVPFAEEKEGLVRAADATPTDLT